ncbi:MAG: type II secretion system GspH family protein [Planctomycetaceae bacterium]|nr:type II secretion system GspH family protein [Planctomycetaceae bacterium]
MHIARRGTTLIELAVAGVLLGTLLVVCLQLLMATAANRKSLEQRQLAAVELGNVMERLATRRWSDLTPQTAAQERLSASVGDRLPGAELKVQVTEQSDPKAPPAKRIAVSLRWQDRTGQYLPPLTITTWRYWKDDR